MSRKKTKKTTIKVIRFSFYFYLFLIVNIFSMVSHFVIFIYLYVYSSNCKSNIISNPNYVNKTTLLYLNFISKRYAFVVMLPNSYTFLFNVYPHMSKFQIFYNYLLIFPLINILIFLLSRPNRLNKLYLITFFSTNSKLFSLQKDIHHTIPEISCSKPEYETSSCCQFIYSLFLYLNFYVFLYQNIHFLFKNNIIIKYIYLCKYEFFSEFFNIIVV